MLSVQSRPSPSPGRGRSGPVWRGGSSWRGAASPSGLSRSTSHASFGQPVLRPLRSEELEYLAVWLTAHREQCSASAAFASRYYHSPEMPLDVSFQGSSADARLRELSCCVRGETAPDALAWQREFYYLAKHRHILEHACFRTCAELYARMDEYLQEKSWSSIREFDAWRVMQPGLSSGSPDSIDSFRQELWRIEQWVASAYENFYDAAATEGVSMMAPDSEELTHRAPVQRDADALADAEVTLRQYKDATNWLKNERSRLITEMTILTERLSSRSQQVEDLQEELRRARQTGSSAVEAARAKERALSAEVQRLSEELKIKHRETKSSASWSEENKLLELRVEHLQKLLRDEQEGRRQEQARSAGTLEVEVKRVREENIRVVAEKRVLEAQLQQLRHAETAKQDLVDQNRSLDLALAARTEELRQAVGQRDQVAASRHELQRSLVALQSTVEMELRHGGTRSLAAAEWQPSLPLSPAAVMEQSAPAVSILAEVWLYASNQVVFLGDVMLTEGPGSERQLADSICDTGTVHGGFPGAAKEVSLAQRGGTLWAAVRLVGGDPEVELLSVATRHAQSAARVLVKLWILDGSDVRLAFATSWLEIGKDGRCLLSDRLVLSKTGKAPELSWSDVLLDVWVFEADGSNGSKYCQFAMPPQFEMDNALRLAGPGGTLSVSAAEVDGEVILTMGEFRGTIEESLEGKLVMMQVWCRGTGCSSRSLMHSSGYHRVADSVATFNETVSISLKIFGATVSSWSIASARVSTFTRRASAAAKTLEEAVHQRSSQRWPGKFACV
mmetsp:Transcript_104628/g.239833  ORF Transcript_104628/g.239833 Transcript_104628/m.239833 type:complete len:791 (+) Transcript_104628:3-2375(+)